jgi:glycerol-3-phosphate acyltransferase PlsY
MSLHSRGSAGDPGALSGTSRGRRLVGAAVVGYLLGTIPSADIAARAVGGGSIDLRVAGSGNPGGMNAMRLLGRRAGLGVMVADISKGALASALGRRLAGDDGAHLASVSAVTGHCFPLWTGFRGGKGIATSFGQCLATFPAYAPLDIASAILAGKAPHVRRPALVSIIVSSSGWIGAGVVWWRRGLPNLWGPRPTGALPLANLATTAVIATASVMQLRRGDRSGRTLDRAPR